MRFTLCLLSAAALFAADPAMERPRIILNPGPEYQDTGRKWQGIPGIERASNGRLWATWYSGGTGEGRQNFVLISTSGDDGQSWSPIKVAVDPDGLVRAYDPVLWIDPTGKLWLFWAQSYTKWDGRGGVWAIRNDNPASEDARWSEPRRIADGVMMNKPTVTRAKEWLLPIAGWARNPEIERENRAANLNLSPESIEHHTHRSPDRYGSSVWVSTDQGKTFQLRGKATPPDTDFDEHMVVERKDGSLLMLARTRFGIGASISTDKGRTWSGWTDTGIPHPTTRFFIRRLKSGNLLMIRHAPQADRKRSHLAAYLSTDDGATWTGELMLDERMNVSYPDGVQAPGGAIYIIYDRERTKAREILMAVFREEDIRAGKFQSTGARQKVIINRIPTATETSGENR